MKKILFLIILFALSAVYTVENDVLSMVTTADDDTTQDPKNNSIPIIDESIEENEPNCFAFIVEIQGGTRSNQSCLMSCSHRRWCWICRQDNEHGTGCACAA